MTILGRKKCCQNKVYVSKFTLSIGRIRLIRMLELIQSPYDALTAADDEPRTGQWNDTHYITDIHLT